MSCGSPFTPLQHKVAEQAQKFPAHASVQKAAVALSPTQQDGKGVLMHFASAAGCNKHDCSLVKCIPVTQNISNKQVIALSAVLGKCSSWKKNILDVPTLYDYTSIAEDSIFHVAGEKNQFSSLISLQEYKDWWNSLSRKSVWSAVWQPELNHFPLQALLIIVSSSLELIGNQFFIV